MQYALITGASMGLGADFARQLAARGTHLLLTARSGDLMEKLKGELLAGHPALRIEILEADLSRAGGVQQIVDWLARLQIIPAWLINNAGFGHAQPFDDLPPESISNCVQVNIAALTDLTRALLPAMRTLPEARIINIGSTAAFQPVPFFGVYAATKAYVLSFTQALHEELINTNVRVTCLCPGPTSTNFNKNNAIAPRMFHKSQTSEEVVRMGLAGNDRNQAIVITQNGLQVFAQRFVPRVWVRKIAAKLLRDALKQ